MSKMMTRQLINAFKANFKNDAVVIPAAIKQEQAGIVYTGLIDPADKENLNSETALSPLSIAGLLAQPGAVVPPLPQLSPDMVGGVPASPLSTVPQAPPLAPTPPSPVPTPSPIPAGAGAPLQGPPAAPISPARLRDTLLGG